jgi:hypothetical protein
MLSGNKITGRYRPTKHGLDKNGLCFTSGTATRIRPAISRHMAIVAESASVADEQSRPSLRQPLANRNNKTAELDSQNRITNQAITSKSHRVDVRTVCLDTDRRTIGADGVSEPASREKAASVAEAD